MRDLNRGAKAWLASRLIRRPGKPTTDNGLPMSATTAVVPSPHAGQQPDFIHRTTQ